MCDTIIHFNFTSIDLKGFSRYSVNVIIRLHVYQTETVSGINTQHKCQSSQTSSHKSTDSRERFYCYPVHERSKKIKHVYTFHGILRENIRLYTETRMEWGAVFMKARA